MPTDRNRMLLPALAAAAFVCAIGVAAYVGAERLRTARERLLLYEGQIEALTPTLPVEAPLAARRDRLRGELEAARSQSSAAEEMNPYAFGALVRQRLAASGMDIARYQVLETGERSLLEFAASGSALAIARFLKDTFESGESWSIPSLTIRTREGRNEVDVVLQVGYEILGQGSR